MEVFSTCVWTTWAGASNKGGAGLSGLHKLPSYTAIGPTCEGLALPHV